MTTEPDRIGGMDALFEEAERRGLWFFSQYQQLWFSPEDLRSAQMDGRFRWGPSNWQLRDPQEYVDDAARKVQQAQADYEQVKARVYRGKARG